MAESCKLWHLLREVSYLQAVKTDWKPAECFTVTPCNCILFCSPKLFGIYILLSTIMGVVRWHCYELLICKYLYRNSNSYFIRGKSIWFMEFDKYCHRTFSNLCLIIWIITFVWFLKIYRKITSKFQIRCKLLYNLVPSIMRNYDQDSHSYNYFMWVSTLIANYDGQQGSWFSLIK